MGENLEIPGRRSVRTPMQWEDSPSAGFSSVPPDALVRPLPDGPYGPAEVNVADQQRDPESLLNWFERLIRLRRESPEIGFGGHTLLAVDSPPVLAIHHNWEDRDIVTVHNLAADGVTVRMKVDAAWDSMRDVMSGRERAEVQGASVALEMDGYEYLWLRPVRGA